MQEVFETGVGERGLNVMKEGAPAELCPRRKSAQDRDRKSPGWGGEGG